MSLRKQDNMSELAVAEFLDHNFYPRHVGNFRRFRDIEMQLQGVDVKFDLGKYKNLLVDEKAAAHFVNKNIPTFAFELDFIGSDKRLKTGWLVDSEKITQAYLISWIWAKKERNYGVDDIECLETVLIKRSAIIELLNYHDVDESRLERISHEMRRDERYGAHFKHSSRPFYFSLTKHLVEKPCNLVIYKKKLIELAELHQFVR